MENKVILKEGLKTIDINCKEWFNKANGNSYFAGRLTLNYGLNDAVSYVLPFQYGYGDLYMQASLKLLFNKGIINSTDMWLRELKDYGVIVRYCIIRNCLKRELTNI